MDKSSKSIPDLPQSILALFFDFPWFEIVGRLWSIARRLIRAFASEGVYEVLDYECQLELKDTDGKIATIKKREKVRYLQDYITTYLDQALGDGEILLNYRCSPGIPVDEYRLGHKTYELISLRDFRNKDDIDEFNIEWKMRNGFLVNTGFWGTAINHRTRKVLVKIIFPKDRPPLRVSITEGNTRRTQALEKDTQQVLPDGRTIVIWEKTKPRLYEDYVLRWEW